MKNKNIFLKIYIVFVIILAISIIVLYVLGKKERIGYLSDFEINVDKTLEINGLDSEETKKLFIIEDKLDETSINNFLFTNISITNYSYNFRIKYYNKVFRNSDIYGVYLNINQILENNNYIKKIEMNENGGPFGNLISSKVIDAEKIDSIDYVLKFKFTFTSILIFIILIYYALFLLDPKIFSKFDILLYRICNNNIYYIFSIILVVVYIFFNDKTIFYWDTINYISRGIDMFYGRNLFVYPGTLFSIITTIPTMLLFNNTQVSYLYYISLVPTIITVVFSYKILIIYTNNRMAINILFIIFVLFKSYIPIMLSQTMADGWLLMFIILSVYFMLNNKIYLSAILISIAYFFRSSLALPLGIFIPILLRNNDNFSTIFSKKSIIYYLKYYLTLILMIFVINFIINIFIKTDNSESGFYTNFINLIIFENLLKAIITTIKGFKLSILPIFILAILSLLLITIKDLNIVTKKISLLGIVYSFICITLTSLLVLTGYKPIDDENRYFIYPILILTISTVPMLYEYLSKYYNLNKITNLLCILLLIMSISKIKISEDIYTFFDRVREYDYSIDYPKIEENASIYVMNIMSQSTLNYIFKNQNWHNINMKSLYDFYNDNNSNYKYLFSTYRTSYNVITDKYGNKFELIWISNLDKSIKYSLYENKSYLK
ncbi:hypothetical protein [Brachyspira pilosicoli]|nr:hypothetical protein [Brachyspira pilosicoli]PLV64315.1 hypothetical protein BPSP16_01220 [Brachyspira pilosicoli SP16]